MKPTKKATHYKPAEDREKDLRFALYRIQKGRSHSGETKITIAAVAREAGVSTRSSTTTTPKLLRLSAKLRGAPVALCVM